MYKLADIYITTQFMSKVIMTIMVFVVIFLLVDIVEHLDYIIDSEIPRSKMFQYFMYSVPWYTSLGLPMALLLGTVFTMGSLQNNNELSAIKSAGISIKRISIPLIILGILFSIFSFYYDNILVTHYLQKRSELRIKYNLGRTKNNNLKKKDIFRQESFGKILGIHRFTFRNQTAHNITLQEFDDGNLISRLDAPAMKWNTAKNIWQLPKFQLRKWQGDSLLYNTFEQDTSLLINFDPLDLTKTTVMPEEMNYWELKDFVYKLDQNGIKDPKWAVNMHFKSAFSCTSFLMILFGLSLSIRRPRSSQAVGIGISVIVIFVYYAAITTGRSFGYNGTLDPFLAVWLPNMIFFITGIYLFQKTRS